MATRSAMPAVVCSCGNAKPHEVARRTTEDGATVLFWSDGSVTDRFSFYLRGLGSPRSNYTADIARRVNEVVREDVCLLKLGEVAGLVKAARALLAGGRWDSDRAAVNYALQKLPAAA